MKILFLLLALAVVACENKPEMTPQQETTLLQNIEKKQKNMPKQVYGMNKSSFRMFALYILDEQGFKTLQAGGPALLSKLTSISSVTPNQKLYAAMVLFNPAENDSEQAKVIGSYDLSSSAGNSLKKAENAVLADGPLPESKIIAGRNVLGFEAPSNSGESYIVTVNVKDEYAEESRTLQAKFSVK